MKIIDRMTGGGFEQLVFCQDGETGLKAIVAIHDTTLGPALGGTRMWPYSSEEEAIVDVMRLARGMTYKAAVAGLSLGGGKAVIIGNPADKTETMLRAYGRFVDTLNGRYITAEDVGTCQWDMDVIHRETQHVTGCDPARGGGGDPSPFTARGGLNGRYITAEDVGTCQWDMDVIHRETQHVTGCDPARGGGGDPSPFTARGVLNGIKAAVRKRYGIDSLAGLKVAVQGLGNVGYHLCRLLTGECAKLVVTDINSGVLQKAVGELGAEVATADAICESRCHVFAPCALGAVVNDETLEKFRCDIIAGAANNVLAEERHGDALRRRGILYVPDYVINAGGLINVADELYGYQRQRVDQRVAQIYNTVLDVLTVSEKEGISTHRAADRQAAQRIKRAKIYKNTSQREVPMIG